MCPSEYGIMAKPCEDLSHYIMEAKPGGCITLKEKMKTDKYQQHYQDAELVKMQSEVSLTEQVKRETRNDDLNNGPKSTDPRPWKPPSKQQISYMYILARKHGALVNEKELVSVWYANEFIRKYAKMPTAKVVGWARKLAKGRRVILHNNILKDQAATSEFIEICLRRTADDMNTFLEHYKDKANAEEEYKASQ